jgi:hypothetical protein
MERDMETRTRRDHVAAALLGAALAGAVALLTWMGSARATEYTALQAVLVANNQVAADNVLVSEPAGWQSGDPMALVIVAGPDRDTLRARLIAELLASRVAVAELVVAPDLHDPGAVVTDAYRTLAELSVDRAPGQVLLYGFAWDVGGYATMAAADPAIEQQMGEGFPTFAAYASLGTGCQVATPRWDEPGAWRLNAIHQGVQVWAADELIGDAPEVDYSATALACGLALTPTVATTDPFASLPRRAAR